MNREDVLKTVQLAIQEQMTDNFLGRVKVPELPSADDTLQHLGMDSFDVLSVGVKLEETYDIRINDEEWFSMITVNDIVDAIMKKL